MAIEDMAAQAGVTVVHAIMRTISVVCVLLVVAGLAAAVYFGFIRPNTKPNPSTTQAGTRDNYSYTIAPHATFGCANFKILNDKVAKVNQALPNSGNYTATKTN